MKGAQRGTLSGRKPERDGSSGQPISFAIRTAVGAYLGVQLVGTALDVLRDLAEEPDDVVAVLLLDREAVTRRFTLEGIEDATPESINVP